VCHRILPLVRNFHQLGLFSLRFSFPAKKFPQSSLIFNIPQNSLKVPFEK